MSVIQLEAFDLPLCPAGAVPVVIQDRGGRLFVDPLLLGVSPTAALMVGMDTEDDPPLCQFGKVTFIELEWLIPLYRPVSPKPPEECRKGAKVIKRLCLDCIATLQGRTVEVEFFEGC